MKALSLWQPWASLWLSPAKIHETRHWPTKYRGWLAVHAAKKFEKEHDSDLAQILRQQFGTTWYRDLPTGAVLGAVNIIDCRRAAEVSPTREDRLCGNFASNRYGFQRAPEFILFKQPVPFRGLQGFFEVPDNLLPEFTARAA
jgi:hypothetical protein